MFNYFVIHFFCSSLIFADHNELAFFNLELFTFLFNVFDECGGVWALKNTRRYRPRSNFTDILSNSLGGAPIIIICITCFRESWTHSLQCAGRELFG